MPMKTNLDNCFLDSYKWGNVTFEVVYCSREARNALMARIEKTCLPIRSRIYKVSLREFIHAVPPEARLNAQALADGWVRNLARHGAMLATGLSAS